MSRERYNGPRNRVSVGNWMWSLVLLAIPGVNIVVLFLFAFLGKTQPKRSLAVAGLLLILIFAVLAFAAFLIFPAELRSFAVWMREQVTVQEPSVPLALP